jgi:tripartite-type tricarboxylate transporter receptor subunit TctC
MRTISSSSAATLLLLLAAGAPAHAQSAADFYRGKQVSLIVAASTGGGYDTYGRTVARHLGEHIPGKPTVVVQNMPAAGGLGAANHTFNVAAKDGTVITLFQNTVPLEPFFENKQAQFDAARFGWLGTPTAEVALYMFWHTSKIKTLKDAQTLDYVAGAAGAASTPAFYGRVFNQIFNMKARFISGYPGQNEILHALEGGEVEAMASPFWSSLKTSRPAWYKEGKIRLLFQYGGEDHPELKSVPRALDLLQTDADKTLLRIAAAPLGLGRPFGVPPGIPADRLAALRTAMMATFKDPAFIADCAKQRLECDIPTSGEELGTLIGRAYAAPTDVRKRLVGMYQVTK